MWHPVSGFVVSGFGKGYHVFVFSANGVQGEAQCCLPFKETRSVRRIFLWPFETLRREMLSFEMSGTINWKAESHIQEEKNPLTFSFLMETLRNLVDCYQTFVVKCLHILQVFFLQTFGSQGPITFANYLQIFPCRISENKTNKYLYFNHSDNVNLHNAKISWPLNSIKLVRSGSHVRRSNGE
jgi:hypothetical protein